MENLKSVFEKYGISISNEQQKKFELFFDFLIEKNKVMNLTAITHPQEVLFKHFLDSVLPQNLFEKNSKIIDVGSGAGFPAIPLKITRDDLQIVMIDSLQKRVNFLNDTTKLLSLQNITALHFRAEDFAKTHKECFDTATARAVAPLNTLVEYLLPFVKIGGKCIIYKSTKLNEEIENAKNAINILGGKIEEIKNYKIDEFELERNVLVIKKIKPTDKKYPRDKNAPKLKPLN